MTPGPGPRPRPGPLRLLWLVLLGLGLCLCLTPGSDAKKAAKAPRCPSTCSCTRDSAFCVDTKAVPKIFPPGIISL